MAKCTCLFCGRVTYDASFETQEYCHVCYGKFIKQLQAKLAKLRWIPVGEGLPDERKETVPFRSKEVVVTDGVTWVRAYWMTRQKWWWFFHDVKPAGKITHYLPITLPDEATK